MFTGQGQAAKAVLRQHERAQHAAEEADERRKPRAAASAKISASHVRTGVKTQGR
jgi:hypothetical protein